MPPSAGVLQTIVTIGGFMRRGGKRADGSRPDPDGGCYLGCQAAFLLLAQLVEPEIRE